MELYDVANSNSGQASCRQDLQSSSKETLFLKVSLCQFLPMLILTRLDAVAVCSPCAL